MQQVREGIPGGGVPPGGGVRGQTQGVHSHCRRHQGPDPHPGVCPPGHQTHGRRWPDGIHRQRHPRGRHPTPAQSQTPQILEKHVPESENATEGGTAQRQTQAGPKHPGDTASGQPQSRHRQFRQDAAQCPGSRLPPAGPRHSAVHQAPHAPAPHRPAVHQEPEIAARQESSAPSRQNPRTTVVADV